MEGNIRRTDPRIRRVLDEAREIVRRHYPAADFHEYDGEDPRGIYLVATVDTTNMFDVLDLVSDMLVDAQVEEGLPVYFEVERPIERTLEQVQSARSFSGSD